MQRVLTSWKTRKTKKNVWHVAFFCLLLLFSTQGLPILAATETPGGKVTMFVTPRAGTFLVGATFDVSVFLDTQGSSINAIELAVKFSQDKLALVRPSGGKSIIGLWVEPPSFSQRDGTARLVGVIPNGITTGSGLITTLTFKTIAPGPASLSILPSSQVLANDGEGTKMQTSFGRAEFTITPEPPQAVNVYSETHPFEDHWYNNNSPSFTWEKEKGVIDFSFELDNKSTTVPDNISEGTGTQKGYEGVSDGINFFHIKAKKDGVWGLPTHYSIHIDTTPPASFRPTIEAFLSQNRHVLSFFTTDSLSGIDHFEVGVFNTDENASQTPIFIEAESPYHLPPLGQGNFLIVVRAIDKAGNIRDENADASAIAAFWSLVLRNLLVVIPVGAFLILLVMHFLFGHKIAGRIKTAVRVLEGVPHEDPPPLPPPSAPLNTGGEPEDPSSPGDKPWKKN